MISKKILYKNQLLKRKMATVILFGIVFLLSTISYYFVNTSHAQNVLKVGICVKDEELNLEDVYYELKVADNEGYTAKLSSIQAGYIVDKYALVSEEEYNKINKLINGNNDDETSIEIKEIPNDENTIETKEISIESDNSTSKEDIKVDESKEATNETINDEKSDKVETENKTEETSDTVKSEEKKDDKKIEEKKIEKTREEIATEISEMIKDKELVGADEEFELNDEQIKTKKIYVIAKYQTKEKEKQLLYNKVITETTEKNTIIVSGYMPKDAKLSVKEVNTSEVQTKIKDKANQEVKLSVAYDVKIICGDKEYEPYEFDEKTQVSITRIDEKNINVWHVKDDDTVEKMDINKEGGNVVFDAVEYSIYGIEAVEEDTNTTEETTSAEEKVDNNIIEENKSANVSTNVSTNTEKEENNSATNTTKTSDENTDKTNSETQPRTKGAPLKAPASTAPDSTLEIDDYDSDYNYYIGKNYTDNVSGVNQGKYKDSNLVRVTLNYYGFAQGETDNEKKARISITETQDIVKNIRCLPVVNGSVSIELMDNPFMDKPTGYGFGGWTASAGSVTQDSNTKSYKLTVLTSSDITVNLYANWVAAKVVYLNQSTGYDTLDGVDNPGTSENAPLGSWEAACTRLYNTSTNRSDRERNIIVVTGNMDSSINYTKDVTGTSRALGTSTYTRATSITSGNTYIISNGNGASYYGIAADGTTIAREQLEADAEVSTNAQWIITSSGNGYTIRNANTGRYLRYNNRLQLSTTSTTWTYSNNRFSYRTGGTTYYIRYSNNAWSASNSTTGATIYLLQYTFVQTGTEVRTTVANSFSDNSYYSDTRNLALTVTSLYNREDYRSNATITLPTNNNGDWEAEADFQMNHVNISTTGYTSNVTVSGNYWSGYTVQTTQLSTTAPWFVGNANNVRLGRGIASVNTSTDAATFGSIMGDNSGNDVGSTSNDDNAYKLVIESGKYSTILASNARYQNYSNYYGTIYLTLGSDIDRASNTNTNLYVYYRLTSSSEAGILGKSSYDEMSMLFDVKSGTFGIDYFDTYINSTTYDYADNCAYAGIYLGGYSVNESTSATDYSDRYCIVEGGKIANLIGGLRLDSSRSQLKTRLYVKGGEIYNIVGGAGRSTTYGDRIIQVTGGTVDYSVTGGSNGFYAAGSGQIGEISNGQTLVYIGGNATIGATTTPLTSLYEVEKGCVLGAGNGNEEYKNSGTGQVDNTHIIIDGSAKILNSVYGGGNYGIVGSSGSTTAVSKIDILGGTINGNVYGGANQNNIYGSTTVNVKGGQVKGAVYGGSNTSGTISTTTTINVTGGTLGQTTNTVSNGALFGGGYGTGTTVSGNATVNILDTDGNVNIYGAAYGGSSLGTISGNTTVKIQDLPASSNTIKIVGNVFAGGKGDASNAATIQGNSVLNVDGSNLTQASVFGGNDINGTTNGNITVNVGQTYTSKVLNVYGGGNEDATGTEADTVKVYLLSHADVTNAFNGGKSADLTTAGVSDTTRAIYLQGGNATNIFGGSDTDGTVTASHVYIQSGTATNVYGGNNEGGVTTASYVYVTGGTTSNVYGGGYKATTPTTNVSLTGGTITNGFGGGNAANVTTANITLNGTTSTNIYGGSNSSGTVNTSNVTITSGTVTNVYGGNNAGGNTVNTNVTVNSPATNVFGGGNQAETTGNTNVLLTSQVTKIYGGGNEAATDGNTYVKLTNARVTQDAFGGGKGSSAIVAGDSEIVVEGTTSIGRDLFGSGDAAANGSQNNANSTVTVLITGGTISGDVYGAANTSVVYGDTVVKIGSSAVNDNTLSKKSISIGGTVFGGGKSNTAGSATYDFDFESVTGDVDIQINATGYDNGTDSFDIGGSIFGSGNAAKISGDGYVTITNYGSASNIKENISIQRATKVTLNNCHMYLEGTTDRTNEIATAIYTFNRIDDLVLKNNTILYLASGVNIVSKMESVDSADAKESVTITDAGLISQTCDNRIYLSQGKNIILKTEAGTNGEVLGMAFVGLYKDWTGNRQFGIYDTSDYQHGDTVSSQVEEIFARNSYVQGKHYTNHDITIDGFYTNYAIDGVIKTKYIEPTPESADYYQWIAGKLSTDLYYEDIELIATKYATTGAYVLSLDGLSYPNTVIDIIDFDVSDLNSNVTLNMPSEISSIASTATEADTKFGLTMTAGNSGWQTRGTTNFLNNATVSEGFAGTTQYLSDNSSTTPTFSFYMDHSKNISNTAVLGNVTIKMQATYVENEEIKIRDVYVIIKLSTNNTISLDKDYYEGAITPGKEYSMFPTTTTTITKKSSFSAYYSLFLSNYSNDTHYYPVFARDYYHVLVSSCVLPANTKITLVDMSTGTVKYYYYIVSSSDYSNNVKQFKFSNFIAMDSTNEPYGRDAGNQLNIARDNRTYDNAYYNSSQNLVYEEFIVQVDFEETTMTASLESENLLIKLLDGYDNSDRVTVNTAQYPMLFSVYDNLDVNASVDLTLDKSIIYMGDSVGINIETEYAYRTNTNGDTVYDTTHIDDQFGLRIKISEGSDDLTAQDLQGIYIRYNNANYFARSDGTFRMKIADAVSNVLTDMVLYTENGDLASGTYTITAQTFGSSDGTNFASLIATDSKNIQIVNTNYGLSVSLDANSVLIDAASGKNGNNTNNLDFTIGYSGTFSSPKIVVSLYRRKYDQVYSYEYELVNLSNYVTNTLTSTSVTNEYLVTNSVQASQNYTLTMKNTGLTTGTYKVVFSLYDNNTHISDIDKAIIIK